MFELGEGRFVGVTAVDSAALCAAVDALSGLDPLGVDTDALPDVVVSLVHAVRVMEAAAASAMVVLSDAGASERTGGLLVGNWWEFRGLGHGANGAWMLRAGALMIEFPVMGAAVRAGELGLDHLRVLDEIRDPVLRGELVLHDADLHMIATSCSSTQWRREVRRLLQGIRDDLAEREEEQRCEQGSKQDEPVDDSHDADGDAPDDHDQPGEDQPDEGEPAGGEPGGEGPDGDRFRGAGPAGVSGDPLDEGWLWVREFPDGRLSIRGELAGHHAEIVRQILAGEFSRQRRAAWVDHDTTGVAMPTAAQLRARALVELIRNANNGDGPGGGRVEAVVVIEADDDLSQRVRSLDGEPIDAALASLLICDAHLQPLIADKGGRPLWLGRSTRLASPSQRRVLAVRDGGCVFPGCDALPEWCDAHHQPGWSHDGGTDIDQMVLLCRRHHSAAHSRHWELRHNTASENTGTGFEWIERSTGTITPARHRNLRSPPDNPCAQAD